jgi:hypothetical protein
VAFQKGQPRPPTAGRKKGTPNKATLLKVEEVLAQKGINPVEEILALIPDLPPVAQAKTWLELLQYTQAKKREDIVIQAEASPRLTAEQLAALKLVAKAG